MLYRDNIFAQMPLPAQYEDDMEYSSSSSSESDGPVSRASYNALRLRLQRAIKYQGGFKQKLHRLTHVEGHEFDYFVKLVEDVAVTIALSFRTKTKGDMFFVLLNFLKLRLGDKPMFSEDVLEFLFDGIECMWNDDYHEYILDEQSEFVDSSLDIVGSIREIIDNFEKYKDLKIVKKVLKTVAYFMAYTLSDAEKKDFDGGIMMEFMPDITRKIKGPTLIWSIFDLTTFLLERVLIAFKTGNPRLILTDPGVYRDWIMKAETTILHSNYLQNPGPHGIVLPTYLHELDNLLLEGETLVKLASTLEGKDLKKMLFQLKRIKHDQVGYDAALRNRESPVAVVITGSSNVAKSSFMAPIRAVHCKVNNLPLGPEYVFTRTSGEKFWSNYRSWKHTAVFDDVGKEKGGGKHEIDRSIIELIESVNNIAFCPPQARVDDKGTTPFWSSLCIYTTNTPHMNFREIFQCPLAAARRMQIIVDIQPKDEYRQKGDCYHFIDSTKIPESEGEILDVWIIRTYTVVPDNTRECPTHTYGDGNDPRCNQNFRFKFLKEYSNIYDFLAWFAVVDRKHMENQKKYMKFVNSIMDYDQCPICILPKVHCRCCHYCGDYKLEHGEHKPECTILKEQSLTDKEIIEIAMNSERVGVPLPERNVVPTLTFAEDLRLRQEALINVASKRYGGTWGAYAAMFFWKWLPFIPPVVRDYKLGMAQVMIPRYRSEGYSRITSAVLASQMGAPAMNIYTTIGKVLLGVGAPILICGVLMHTLLKKKPKKLQVPVVPWYDDRVCKCDMCNINKAHLVYAHVDKPSDNCSCRLCHKHLLLQDSKKNVADDLSKIPVMSVPALEITDAAIMSENVSIGEVEKAIGAIRPKPDVKQRPDVWKRSSYELSPFELGKQTISWKAMDNAEVCARMYNNIRRVKIYAKDQPDADSLHFTQGHMFGVCSHFYIINIHSTTGFPCYMESWTDASSIGTRKKFKVLPEHVKQVAYDLYLVFIPHFPPLKDVRQLLPNIPLNNIMDVDMLCRSKEGDKYVLHGSPVGAEMVCSKREGTASLRVAYKGTFDRAPQNGDCGAPYLWFSHKGPILLGVHALGEGNTGACEILLRHLVDQAVASLGPMRPVDIGAISLGEHTLIEVHSKSPTNYLENGRILTIGSLNKRKIDHKSRLVVSIGNEILRARGFTTKYVIPTQLDTYRPWFIGIEARTRDGEYFDASTYRLAARSYCNMLDVRNLACDVFITDLHTAVNGLAEVDHVNALDFNTSAGFPHNKSKKNFFIGEPGNRHLLPAIEEEVVSIFAAHARGERCNPVFTTSPKDEPVSGAKDEAGKYRLFMGAPLAWVIVVRMNLLWASKFFQTHMLDVEMGVSMNAMSDDWEIATQYLQQHGDKIIAGDYAGFDTYNDIWVAWYAMYIIIYQMRKHGASDGHIRSVECIASEMTYGVAWVWVVVVMLFACTLSGVPITLWYNCLKNSLYMRCVYLELNPDRECNTFHEFVALITMGDDNIMNVSDAVPWFNHTAISQCFGSVGITYTMADKDAPSIPYIALSDATFVKRSFIYSPQFGSHICPLDKESIIKSLFFRDSVSPLDAEEHFITVCDNALREAAYHGEEYFNYMHEQLLGTISSLNLTVKAKLKRGLYYTYEEHVGNWIRNSDPHVNPQWSWCNYIPRIKTDVSEVLSPCFLGEEQCEECLESIRLRHMALCRAEANQKMPNSTSYCKLMLISMYRDRFECGVELFHYLGVPQKAYLGMCFLTLRSEVVTRFMCMPCESAERFLSHVLPWLSETINKEVVVTTLQKTPTIRASVNIDAQKQLQTLMNKASKLMALLSEEAASIMIKKIELLLFGHFMQEQSEEGVESNDVETIIEFVDDKSMMNVTYPSSIREVYDRSDASVDLSKWLSRPILIDTYTMQLADVVGTNHVVNPWYQFFTNGLVENKLKNFAFIRCDLYIKCVISGTPFVYGWEGIFYAPMQSNPTTGNQLYGTPTGTPSGNQHLTLLTQLKGVYINPQDSISGELKLPYINNQNWLALGDSSATAAVNFNAMGSLIYYRMAALQSANGSTTDGITVNTFCWAENVELAGATTALVYQSERGKEKRNKPDEYGKGPVSGPASAVAALSSWFTKTPIIGPFATATEMGARAIAAGATSLGYTNVPTIDNIHGYRPMAMPPISSSEIGFPFEKLSLDPKNELTIDNTAIGLSSMDELNISYLVQKEAYIGSATWSQTSAESTILCSLTVAPNQLMQVDTTTYGAGSAVATYLSPVAYFSHMFNNWRGDIIIRLVFVKSQYHRGRVSVVWDPAGTNSTNCISIESFNAPLREIVDIATTHEVEFRIPYLQATEWLYNAEIVTSASNTGVVAGGHFSHIVGSDNGTFSIRVLNELSAPSVSATVGILIFARAADNFELANPRMLDYPNVVSLMAPQAEVGVERTEFGTSRPKPERYLTNFGEGYVSLRQLLRRVSYVGTDTQTCVVGKLNVLERNQSRFPMSAGWDTNGFYTANQQVAGGTANFNYTHLHPIDWVKSCFTGVRGSVNWIFNPICNSGQGTFPINDFVAQRNTSSQTYTAWTLFYTGPTDNSQWASFYRTYFYNTSAGAAITDTRVQPTLAIAAPNYTRYFFQATNPLTNTFFTPTDGSNYDTILVTYSVDLTAYSGTAPDTHLSSYAGIGVDFNVLNFLHVPPVYTYASLPTPA